MYVDAADEHDEYANLCHATGVGRHFDVAFCAFYLYVFRSGRAPACRLANPRRVAYVTTASTANAPVHPASAPIRCSTSNMTMQHVPSVFPVRIHYTLVCVQRARKVVVQYVWSGGCVQ